MKSSPVLGVKLDCPVFHAVWNDDCPVFSNIPFYSTVFFDGFCLILRTLFPRSPIFR